MRGKGLNEGVKGRVTDWGCVGLGSVGVTGGGMDDGVKG